MPNGDDDYPSPIFGGKDWGGGMYSEPEDPQTDDNDDNGYTRKNRRRARRPMFRSERKARRTGR